MRFLFWADRESAKLSPLIESARAEGIVPQPIGMGRTLGGDWGNTLFKQQALFDAVQGLDDREIVCATDGFDVFFQQGAESMREKFLALDCEVVFSAERGYSHQYRAFKRFYDRGAGSSPYKYLNAGCVMGYAKALERLYRPSRLLRLQVDLARRPPLRRLLSRLPSTSRVRRRHRDEPALDPVAYLRWFEYTDQAHLGRQIARGRDDGVVTLDRDCTLFWCTAFEWEDVGEHCELVGGKLQNRHTGRTPACIHVPWESRHRAVFEKLYESVHVK